MCKRKRPKYKVGDILEEWFSDHNPSVENFLITDIKYVNSQRYRKADRKWYVNDESYYVYTLVSLTSNKPIWMEVDIIEMKRIWRECNHGYRKVA